MDIAALRAKSPRYAVGLMSGTSCDGVDAALVRIKGSGHGLHVKLVSFQTFPYTPDLRARLLASRLDAHELCLLNAQLGERFADAVHEMVRVAEEEGFEVDFVASHGHTAAHIPPGAGEIPATLQIGEPAVIAERAKLPVVANFRQRDIAAGGQGAPLVAYADWVLFRRGDRTAVCLNIGGIANLTVVAPDFEDVIAFDTGPGNMIIDGAVRFLTKNERQMDENGRKAADGVVIDEFLDYLLDHPYFAKAPPKSTGREDFGPAVYLHDALAARREHPPEDLIATVTAAAAYSIVRAYKRFVEPHYEVKRFIVSGGGAHNKTLMRRIKQGLSGTIVRTSEYYGIPTDAREAIAFAILGNETVCGTPANVPRATGAAHPVILGSITP